MNERDELTEQERRLLAGLRKDIDPPPALERSIVSELASRGLIRHARQRRASAANRFALLGAAAALFGFGILVGRRPAAPRSTDSRGRYMLLLEGAGARSAVEETTRVNEYSAWARAESRAGRLLEGEELRPESIVLPAGQASVSGTAVLGYFVIAAGSDDEALTIARRCPHLRHGGVVVVRKIAGSS